MATRSPQLVYPNNGVMLPPNIQSLEVHWKPGAAANTLAAAEELARLASGLRGLLDHMKA